MNVGTLSGTGEIRADGGNANGWNGNADMVAPIMILKAGGAAGLRLSPTNSFSTGNLLLIGASLAGPAGVLRPGQTWSIPFSAQATASVTIPFEVDYETADATDLVDYHALSISAPAPVSFAASTGADGTFAISGLVAGNYVLQVRNFACRPTACRA